MTKKIHISILFLIFFLSAAFRLNALNWDNNFHMHPDERAIILAILTLAVPSSFQKFFSVNSPLNPHFFAYGSFPFYLLKFLGDLTNYSTYDGYTILGRLLSALFDMGTVILLYLLGKKVKGKYVGLIAAFFYGFSVLPIQLSHFYAVDTILTFFIVLSLLLSLSFYEKPSIKKAALLGITFGFSLATKVSAVILISSFLVMLTVDFFLIFIRSPHKPKHWFPHLPKVIKTFFLHGACIGTLTIVTFLLLAPYVLIDSSSFWIQTQQQQAMTKDAFTFPYTLQYVNKTPYVYEIKNLLLFGMGIPLGIFCILGTLFTTIHTLYKDKKEKWGKEILLLSFFWVYFLIVGQFAIGFMRYLLPLYPLLALFGALLIYHIALFLKQKFHPMIFVISSISFVTLIIVWPVSFSQIYQKPNTRIQATDWIHRHIPAGKVIAIEHWDDAIPIIGQENYTMHTLPLYDPDTPEKWQIIDRTLGESDYIILASNRLYAPLMKLTNCQVLPTDRCYALTSDYYTKLFNGSLGFKKVAEFTSFPIIPFINIQIDDSAADESFTVYDHPKIMIFKKQTP